MERKARGIIADALFQNNYKLTYAGDMSKFIDELDKKLNIEIKE